MLSIKEKFQKRIFLKKNKNFDLKFEAAYTLYSLASFSYHQRVHRAINKLVFPDLHGSGLIASELTLVYFVQKRENWSTALTASCECGSKDQTAENVITSCIIYHHSKRSWFLSDVDKNLTTWQMKTCPAT